LIAGKVWPIIQRALQKRFCDSPGQLRDRAYSMPKALRQIINAAERATSPMILLGINCGFGNNDVGTLPLSAVDLGRRLDKLPSAPKTGIDRALPAVARKTVEATGTR